MNKVKKIQELLEIDEAVKLGIVTAIRGSSEPQADYVVIKSKGGKDIGYLYCANAKDAMKLEEQIIKYCIGFEKGDR